MDPSLSNVLSSAEVQAFASGFPVMVMHLIVTLLLLAAGATVYALLTPWKEVALIRQGNVAAAIAFATCHGRRPFTSDQTGSSSNSPSGPVAERGLIIDQFLPSGFTFPAKTRIAPEGKFRII